MYGWSLLQSIDSVYGLDADFDAGCCQMVPNRFANKWIVIDDENAGHYP
jgi:hypothetical protein